MRNIARETLELAMWGQPRFRDIMTGATLVLGLNCSSAKFKDQFVDLKVDIVLGL